MASNLAVVVEDGSWLTEAHLSAVKVAVRISNTAGETPPFSTPVDPYGPPGCLLTQNDDRNEVSLERLKNFRFETVYQMVSGLGVLCGSVFGEASLPAALLCIGAEHQVEWE